MALQIINADITKLKADAIVNAANTELRMGGGVCGAIFRAAGAEELQQACGRLAPIKTGEAVITPAFALPARYIIHTAGPIYSSQEAEKCEKQLKSAYTSALRLAAEKGCKSIAFPLISSGIYGYPREAAKKAAVVAIQEFLKDNEMEVILALL